LGGSPRPRGGSSPPLTPPPPPPAMLPAFPSAID